MNALALTLDLLYSEGVVLSASSGLSPGRLILRGTQTFCFRRHGSSQILILSSGMLILSTGVEPESLKSICLRTLPPKSFGHQNPLRQNTICVLILSTGVEPESPKSIGLRTLPPKSFAPQNPLPKNTIFVLILSTGVAPESPKSISLRTLPPKSFVEIYIL